MPFDETRSKISASFHLFKLYPLVGRLKKTFDMMPSESHWPQMTNVPLFDQISAGAGTIKTRKGLYDFKARV